MAEGEPHEAAVARAKDILGRQMGWKILENSDKVGKGGFEFPTILIDGQPIQWTADVCGHTDGSRAIVEADSQEPGQGHNSAWAKSRDYRRDVFLYQYFGIRTVRLWTSELVGAGAMSDGLIIKEILFQLDFWERYGKPTLK